MEPHARPTTELAGADPVFIAGVREDMLRFARLQLGTDDEAEGAVQEALAGALRNAASFRGEAALKTWIIAILKNKVADILRQRQRRPINASQIPSQDQEGALPAVFDQKGLWRDAARPARWEDPQGEPVSCEFRAAVAAAWRRCKGRCDQHRRQGCVRAQVPMRQTRSSSPDKE